MTGTAVCSFSSDGVTLEGDPGGFRVSCELEMSDPRVSGTETHDRFRFYAGDTETEEAIGRRMEHAREELEQLEEDRLRTSKDFHYVIVNDEIEAAAEEPESRSSWTSSRSAKPA